MVDVVSLLAGVGELSESLDAVDLVFMSETIIELNNRFMKWKESFESKGKKVSLWKATMMDCNSILKDGLSKSRVDPCLVCSLRVKGDSVLCVHCRKMYPWYMYLSEKSGPKFSGNFACRKCEGY